MPAQAEMFVVAQSFGPISQGTLTGNGGKALKLGHVNILK